MKELCYGSGAYARVFWGLGRQVLVGAHSAHLLLKSLEIRSTRSPTVEAATRFSVHGIRETHSGTPHRYLLELPGTMMDTRCLPLVVEIVHWTFQN